MLGVGGAELLGVGGENLHVTNTDKNLPPRGVVKRKTSLSLGRHFFGSSASEFKY